MQLEGNAITLSYQQSITVVKAFNAVEQLGYEEQHLYLSAFKENENQIYIQIADGLNNDYIDITITKGIKNATTN